MGKIGSITTVVARIFIIIALVGVFVSTVAAAFIPKDFLTVSGDSSILVNVNFASFGKMLTDEEVIQGRREVESILEEEAADGADYSINAIDINQDGIYVTTAINNIDFNLHNLVWVLLFCAFYLAMTLVTLFFIGSLFKAFQNCRSPFEQNVIRKMRNLAFSLIPWTVLSSVSGTVIRSFFSKSFQISVGIDLKIVMVVLIILALTYIFQYGAVLQRESDETL